MESFLKLYDDALSATQRYDDASLYEPYFVAVLSFIKKHPDLIQNIKATVCNVVEKGNVLPYELIAFCMHELRWPEVLDSANKRIQAEDRNPHARRLAELIVEAYDPMWDCRVLYSYYSAHGITGGKK